MLYLISLGLRDEQDLSLRGLGTAKKCDSLYVELYTNNTATSAGRLSRLVGKPVKELDRKGMENDSGALLEEAKEKDVGVFVPGDALSATTHLMLLKDAREQGIKAEVIHGSSIFTAVAETGLQLYKFGRTVTLTSPVQQSTIKAIEQNQQAGLHTLILLDITMDAAAGAGLLKGALKGLLGAGKKGKKMAAACQLGGGSGDSIILYNTAEELEKAAELKGRTPAIIAIPGSLHFSEEEYLQTMEKRKA